MSNVELICWCGQHYTARQADLNRGWGMSCSKSHAATKRDYGRAQPTRVSDGSKVQPVNGKKRGAKRIKPDTRTYPRMVTRSRRGFDEDDFGFDEDPDLSWDAHKDSF